MENKNFNVQFESNENKAKSVWRNIGIAALSFLVAVVTVIVINI